MYYSVNSYRLLRQVLKSMYCHFCVLICSTKEVRTKNTTHVSRRRILVNLMYNGDGLRGVRGWFFVIISRTVYPMSIFPDTYPSSTIRLFVLHSSVVLKLD